MSHSPNKIRRWPLIFGNPETGPIQGGMPKHDVVEGVKEEKLNAKELSAALLAKGFNSKERKADLLKCCESAGIATTRTVPNVKQPGWLGKAKGSLHILYERGMVDKNNLSQYTQKGKKDDFGNCMKETSLGSWLGYELWLHTCMAFFYFYVPTGIFLCTVASRQIGIVGAWASQHTMV